METRLKGRNFPVSLARQRKVANVVNHKKLLIFSNPKALRLYIAQEADEQAIGPSQCYPIGLGSSSCRVEKNLLLCPKSSSILPSA